MTNKDIESPLKPCRLILGDTRERHGVHGRDIVDVCQTPNVMTADEITRGQEGKGNVEVMLYAQPLVLMAQRCWIQVVDGTSTVGVCRARLRWCSVVH